MSVLTGKTTAGLWAELLENLYIQPSESLTMYAASMNTDGTIKWHPVHVPYPKQSAKTSSAMSRDEGE